MRNPTQAEYLRRLWTRGNCFPGRCLHCAHLKDFVSDFSQLCTLWHGNSWRDIAVTILGLRSALRRLCASLYLCEWVWPLWVLWVTARASFFKSYWFWSHFRRHFSNLWLKRVFSFLLYLCNVPENLVESYWCVHCWLLLLLGNGGSPEWVKSRVNVHCWHQLAVSETQA